MKKIITLASILAIATPAMAGFQGDSNNGGYASSQKSSGTINTVAKAKQAHDNARFSLVGNITNCFDDDECTFKDATGSIRIDVEDGAWRGQTVNARTKVSISGKVDRDDGRVTLDVHSISVR